MKNPNPKQFYYYRHRGKKYYDILKPFVQEFFPYHKPEISGVDPRKAARVGAIPKPPYDLSLGQVLPEFNSNKSEKNIAKVQIHKLCLNRFLLKYYYQKAQFFVHTNGIPVKAGDIVLIDKPDTPVDFNTVLRLKKVVFSSGDITDPVSGLKCEGPDYSEHTLSEWVKKMNLSVKVPEIDKQ